MKNRIFISALFGLLIFCTSIAQAEKFPYRNLEVEKSGICELPEIELNPVTLGNSCKCCAKVFQASQDCKARQGTFGKLGKQFGCMLPDISNPTKSKSNSMEIRGLTQAQTQQFQKWDPPPMVDQKGKENLAR